MAKRNDFESGDASKYTVTTFISFVVMLVFLLLMMQWQGYFKPTHEAEAQSSHETHGNP